MLQPIRSKHPARRHFDRQTDGLKRERTTTGDPAPLKIIGDAPTPLPDDPATKR